ncbi:OmpA family protein [Nodosilinea sp. LEGE 07298]|uniref:OmpA family protein n=1 Tax=Nodosilinea sp. LEGE 07298 TaxID=2777970 RepID=UPI00187F87DB|nr:OmpA family protein [Nodosilinea sp. LEGE 07298]MBE9109519.1 OmpA family protein [Nodosilinea sp. LEGE 07298]
MLGAGVSVGWLVGLLVAQVLPARNPEPPLAEVALRYSSQTVRKLQQLPQWWRGDRAVGLADEALVGSAAPESPGEDPGTGATEAERPLNESDRDRIAADLTNLRQDLTSLNNRLEALETNLDLPASTGSVEDRLQRLDQRLDADDAVSTGAAEAETPAAPAEPPAEPPTESPTEPQPTAEPVGLNPYQESRFPLVRDRVVLPSALLFEPGSPILTSPGQQLLDSIAPDLRRYGAATLLVGSHTDSTTAPGPASQLALQQSLAVQQYLAPQLEGSGSRWVAVGYGSSRPLVTDTAADQQRNQRVEIGIVPGR